MEAIELVNEMNFTGKRFSRLVVEGVDHYGERGCVFYKCKCDCGNEVVLSKRDLEVGRRKSCGCLGRECTYFNFPQYRHDQTTHGESRTRLYHVWTGMCYRCSAKGTSQGRRYADLGIKVCDEWANSYEAFRDWALANGYDSNASYNQCTLDRIDVYGDYEPSNCRWATAKEQGRNRRDTCYVEFRGREMPLKEVCEITKIPYATLWRNVKQKGMTVEEVIAKRKHRNLKVGC